LQELLTGTVLSPGGSLTSKQLQRMVTALDLTSDKGAEISALEADLVQAKSKALLYEVQSINQAINQASKQSSNQSSKQSIHRSIKQASKQASNHQAINQAINQSTFSVFETHYRSQQTIKYRKMTYTRTPSLSHGSRSSPAWPPFRLSALFNPKMSKMSQMET